MGAFSRSKGQRVEREIAKVLELFFDTKVSRRLGQERDSGEDLEADLPFVFEIKARKSRAGVQKFLEQAAVVDRPGKLPVAIVKADNEPPIVVMYLKDFCEVAIPYVAEHREEHRGSRRVP